MHEVLIWWRLSQAMKGRMNGDCLAQRPLTRQMCRKAAACMVGCIALNSPPFL
jgi:hypothetical protein